MAALPDPIESLVGQSLMDGRSSYPSGGSSISTQSTSSFSFLGFPSCPQQETFAPSEAGEPLFSSDDRDLDDLSIQSDLPQALPFEQWAATLGSREDAWVRGLVSSGIDRDIASLIPNCHKDSTKRQYESAWKKWKMFCYTKGIRTEDVLMSTIINFLGRNFLDENRALSTIQNYFYALKDPVRYVYNLDISINEDVKKLFAAIWRQKPGRRGMALMPTWSLEEVLNFLNSSVYEPLELASERRKLEKAFLLVLLATGRRICELSSMIRVFESFPNGMIKFRWFDGFKAKAESFWRNWLSSHPRIVPISSQNNLLCPVRAFRCFYACNSVPAWEGGMWPLGKIKLSYLVRDTVIESFGWAHPGVPTDNWRKPKCHDFRKLACSYSRSFFTAPWSQLCDLVGTKAWETLDKCYVRKVPPVKATFQVPLGTIYPNSEILSHLRDD